MGNITASTTSRNAGESAEDLYGVYVEGNLTVSSGILKSTTSFNGAGSTYSMYVDGNVVVNGGTVMASAGDTDESSEGSSYGLYTVGNITVNSGTLRASSGNVLNEAGESHGIHVAYNNTTQTGGTISQTGGTIKAYSGKTAYAEASDKDKSSIAAYTEIAPSFTGGTTEIKAGSSDGQNHNVYGLYVADTTEQNAVVFGMQDRTSKASATISTYKSMGGNAVGFATVTGVSVNMYFGKVDVTSGGQTADSEGTVNAVGMLCPGDIVVTGGTLNTTAGATYGDNTSEALDLSSTGTITTTDGQLNASGALSESTSICINNAASITAAGGAITAKVYNSPVSTGIVVSALNILGGSVTVNDVTTSTTPSSFTGIKCAGEINFGDTSNAAYAGSLTVNKANASGSAIAIDNLGTNAKTTVHANFGGKITATSGDVSDASAKSVAYNTSAFDVEASSSATISLTSGNAMGLNSNSMAIYSNGNMNVNGANVTLNAGNTGYHETVLASGTFGINSTGKVVVAGATFTVNAGSAATNDSVKQLYGIYTSYSGDEAAITLGATSGSSTTVNVNTVCSGNSDGGDNVGISSTNGIDINKATVNVTVGGATGATCYQDTKYAGIYGGNASASKGVSVINSKVNVTSGAISGSSYINVYGIAGSDVEFDGSTVTSDMGAVANTSTSGISTLNGIKAYGKFTNSESTVNAYNDAVTGNNSSATIDDAAIDAKDVVIPSGTVNAGVYSTTTSQNAAAVNITGTLDFGSTANTPTLNINQPVSGRTVATTDGNNYGLVIGSACTSASFISGTVNIASGNSANGKSIGLKSATSATVQFANTAVVIVSGNGGAAGADASVAAKFDTNPSVVSGTVAMSAGHIADGTTYGIALVAEASFTPGEGYALKNSNHEAGTGNFRQANASHPLEIKLVNVLSLGEAAQSDPTGKGT